MPDHVKLAQEIHQDNIDAGWWKQTPIIDQGAATGEWATIPRNIGELLCLVHSEISEAWEGAVTNALDDKLPLEHMFDVELADTAIRLYDILGYCKTDIKNITIVRQKLVDNLAINLNWIHYHVSQAMEGFRKSDQMKAEIGLLTALYAIWDLADLCDVKLIRILFLKRQFNAIREDHKLENRAKIDGKKF
jgi:hypothetical protein